MVNFCFPLRKLHKVHIINRFLIVFVVTGWYNYVCHSISFSPVTGTKSKNIWQPFQTHLQTRQVHSCLSMFLFCEKNVFCFNFFYWLFCFPFWLYMFRFNLIFVSFGYLFLVVLWFSFSKWTSNDFNFFSTLIRKINEFMNF